MRLGVAGSHASGTTEYSQSGGEVKRAHAGIGAAGGIRSARLAQLGLSGPPTIFEGKRGFLQAFCNAHDARFLHEHLGSHWHFPGARRAQAPCLVRADPPSFRGLRQAPRGARDCARRHRAGGAWLRAVDPGPHRRHRPAPHGHRRRPVQRRVRHCHAHRQRAQRCRRLSGRRGRQLPETRRWPRLPVACASKSTRNARHEIPKGKVTLHMRDGDVLSATAYALGSPFNPLSRGDIEQKYLDLVARDFGDETASPRSV